MIFIGLGANLPHPEFGAPKETVRAAIRALDGTNTSVLACAPLYESSPVPVSADPWFVNTVLSLETGLSALDLLELMHEIEDRFGRVRGGRNAPRVLDIDLIAYGNIVSGPDQRPVLPHPRMSERAFVLMPLRDIAPDWRHPKTGAGLHELLSGLPPDQECRRMSG